MPFKIHLTDEQKNLFFTNIETDIAQDRADRSLFDDRRKSIYNAYRNRPKKKTDPWPGCAATSVPLLTRAVDRMAISSNETVAPRGNFSTITAIPTNESGFEETMARAQAVSDYISYLFRNKMNMTDEWDRFTRSFLTYGNAFGKVWFDRCERSVRKIERQPAFDMGEIGENGEEPEVIQIDVLEGMDAMYEGKRIRRSRDAGKTKEGYPIREYEVWNDDIKEYRTEKVAGYYDEDRQENVYRIDKKETIRNSPNFQTIDLDDIYFSLDDRCISGVHHVEVRHYMTLSEVKEKQRTGFFDQLSDDDMEKLEREAGDTEESIEEEDLVPRTTLDVVGSGSSVRLREDEVEGTETRVKPLEFWECFRKVDIDDDGEAEDMVFWVELSTKTVARVEYLSVEYLMNDIPIVHAGYIPIGTRLLCIGIGEVLFPVLTVLNKLINNRQDAADLKLNPGGFYRPGSGFPPGKVQWRPGTFWPLDQPQQDFLPYQPFNDTRDSIEMEKFFFQMAEDLSIASSTTGTQGKGTPRTARGTIALLQQDAIKLDYILKRLLPALSEVCHKVLGLLRDHGPEREEFRVVGSNKIQTITKDDLSEKYDFFFDIDSVSANREIRRQFTAVGFQSLMPILMQPPGALPPGAIRLARKFMDSLDWKDKDQILPEPVGYEREPRNQEEEIGVMLQGIPVEPILADNHAEHIAIMHAFELSPAWGDQEPGWVETIWRPHLATHFQMQREIERQQQVVQGGGQAVPNQGPGGGAGAIPGLGAEAEIAPEAVGSTFRGGF